MRKRMQGLAGVTCSLRHVALLFVAVAMVGACLVAKAQMVDPAMDKPGEPFSYFSQPTDVVGLMNAPSATEITPEGFLYTGFGELMFFTGPERQPIRARVRTLDEGVLPVVSYAVENLGIQYRFTVFAAQIPEPQRSESASTGQIANFVRVTMTNSTATQRAAFLSAAIRYQGEQTTAQPQPDNRFRRPAQAARIGDYIQPGEPFREDWSYRMGEGLCVRDERVLFRYPVQPAPSEQLTLHTHYNRVLPLQSDKLKLTPETPVCTVGYALPLAPGETRALDFVMPLLPSPAASAETANVRAAQYEPALAGVKNFWHGVLARGMQIELPEQKPVQTFYASLVYDLLGRNLIEGQSVQTAEQFQYHRFYLRDSADYVRMYDATGYGDVAGEVLRFFLQRQQPDGNFVSQPQQYDGWGEAMWAFGEHFRMTHDLAFAAQVFPAMTRAVDWLIQARAQDPMHLMPGSDVRDNEYVPGHLTGYNFLALDGLDAAILMADALHKTDELARFRKERESYRQAFFPLLDKVAAEHGNRLPPSLDAKGWGGTDWGNLLSVTPEPQLKPWDPKVTATLRASQARYQEGITTYAEPDDGVFLHHYLTIKNTLTELVRGEQEQAVREFYAELLHTSSTHGGFEYAIRPWGMRDFQGNLAPHAWFAADFRNLLRNMMVREDGAALHLLSAVSPEWVGAGKTVTVRGVTTYFGVTDFTLQDTGKGELLLQMQNRFTQSPKEVVVSVPWFLQVQRATVGGKGVEVRDGSLHLPPTAREVRMQYVRREQVPMNFDETVQQYEREYRERWERLLQTGKVQN